MTRPTEVQRVIVANGLERGMIKLITELFERQAKLERDIVETNQIQLQLANAISQVVDGAGAMRNEIEKMQNRHGDDDDDLPLAT